MRILVGSFFFVLACAASQSTTTATTSTASAAPMHPARISTCPATFEQASSLPIRCDTEPLACTYAEGTCQCENACVGGDMPAPHPLAFVCTTRACAGPITEGAACAIEGTHCGRCYQTWDCKNGKWSGSSRPPPP